MPTPPVISTPLQAPRCPLCGQPNLCAASAAGTFAVDCWCQHVDFPASLLAAVPAALQGQACICRACAERHATIDGEGRPGAAPSSPAG